VLSLLRRLDEARLAGVTAAVPGFTNVTVHYLPHLVEAHGDSAPWAALAHRLVALARGLDTAEPPPSREIEIAVCYEPELAPDLSDVARHAGLSAEEVVALHTAPTYLVHMIGFLPGFAYLGGMDPRLATPRRATPRTAVPAGSVAIGGSQTGVYPLASPGGWHIIGRTATPLLDTRAKVPALLRVGDRVRFRAIGEAEYRQAGGA
jgi:inhibitor of KinA